MTREVDLVVRQREIAVNLEPRIDQGLRWLIEAAEIVGGKGSMPNDDTVFPLPPEVRRDAPDPGWDKAQVKGAQTVAANFGYGALEDKPTGLDGGIYIAEGGLAWKIAAELRLFQNEKHPRALHIAGSQHRGPLSQAEHSFTQDKLGRLLGAGGNEYHLARSFTGELPKMHTGLPEVLHFGYEVADGNKLVREPTGQFTHIGHSEHGYAVGTIRVDRENFIDDEGKPAYRFQPTPERLMGLVHEILVLQGNLTAPIGYLTSHRYASRVPDAWLAGLKHGRRFEVGMYGQKTLAKVKGVEVDADQEINQLPGDLRVMWEKLHALQDTVDLHLRAEDADRAGQDQG